MVDFMVVIWILNFIVKLILNFIEIVDLNFFCKDK